MAASLLRLKPALDDINAVIAKIRKEAGESPLLSHPVSLCLADEEPLLEHDQAYEVMPVKPSYSKPSKITDRLDVKNMICPICRQDLKGAKKADRSDEMHVGEVPELIYYDYTEYTCPHCGFRFTDADPDDLYPIIAPFRISIQDLCIILTVKLGGIFASGLKLPDLNQNMFEKGQSEEQWFAACASLFLRPVKGYLKSLVAKNCCIYSDTLRLESNDGSKSVKACLLHTPEWADLSAVYLDLQNTDIADALAQITGSKVEVADFERGLWVDDGKNVKGREHQAGLYEFWRKISCAVAAYDQKYLKNRGKNDFYRVKTLFKKLRMSKIIDGSFSYQNPMDVLVFLLSLMGKCSRLMHIENCAQLKTLSEHKDRGSFECYAQMIRERREVRAKMQSYKTEIDTIASALAQNCLIKKKQQWEKQPGVSRETADALIYYVKNKDKIWEFIEDDTLGACPYRAELVHEIACVFSQCKFKNGELDYLPDLFALWMSLALNGLSLAAYLEGYCTYICNQVRLPFEIACRKDKVSPMSAKVEDLLRHPEIFDDIELPQWLKIENFRQMLRESPGDWSKWVTDKSQAVQPYLKS